MAAQFEKTISATEFKATCLDLMAQVASGKLKQVRVTKRGKPIVVMTAVEDANEPWNPESIFGCMKDWPSPVPSDHDWNQPLYTDEELDGFVRATEEQVEAIMRRPLA